MRQLQFDRQLATNRSQAVELARLVATLTQQLDDNRVAREYIAEAIRAYLTNPNYLKTAAPRTAAAIRAAVNPNPRLNRIIQFN